MLANQPQPIAPAPHIFLVLGPTSPRTRVFLDLEAADASPALFFDLPDTTLDPGEPMRRWVRRLLSSPIPIYLTTVRQETIDAFLDAAAPESWRSTPLNQIPDWEDIHREPVWPDGHPETVRVIRCRERDGVVSHESLDTREALWKRDFVGIDFRQS